MWPGPPDVAASNCYMPATMLDYGWLWLDEELSDVKIRLVVRASKGVQQATGTATGLDCSLGIQKAASPLKATEGCNVSQDAAACGTAVESRASGGNIQAAAVAHGSATAAHQEMVPAASHGNAVEAAAPMGMFAMAAASANGSAQTDTAAHAMVAAADDVRRSAPSHGNNLEAEAAFDVTLISNQQHETQVVVPARMAVLATASGYWKARLMRWRSSRREAATATGATAAAAPITTAAAAAAVGTTATQTATATTTGTAAATGTGAGTGTHTATATAVSVSMGIEVGMEEEGEAREEHEQPASAEGAAVVDMLPARKRQKVELQSQVQAAVVAAGPATCSVPEQAAPNTTSEQVEGGSLAAPLTTNIVWEQVDSEPELKAVYSVLQHAYTQQLPKDATLSQLMQMAVHADRWDMPQSLEACLNEAAKLGDLTVDDVTTLLRDDWPPAIPAHGSFRALANNCAAALVRQFGRVQAVVTDSHLLQAFCGLNFNAAHLWAVQDGLQIDSENTVAVLITHWFRHNVDGMTPQQWEAACAAMTGAIRPGYMTSTFLLCTLEKLLWFRPSPHAAAVLRVMNDTLLVKLSQPLQSGLPQQWLKPPREETDTEDATLEWLVTKAQLDELHELAGQPPGVMLMSHSSLYWCDADVTGVMLMSDSSLYWCGYMWQPGLQLDGQQSSLAFGLRYASALPPPWHEAGMPPLLPATFKLIINGMSEELVFEKPTPMGLFLCASNGLLGVPATTEPRANSYPPDNLWKDGRLHLKVEMFELW